MDPSEASENSPTGATEPSAVPFKSLLGLRLSLSDGVVLVSASPQHARFYTYYWCLVVCLRHYAICSGVLLHGLRRGLRTALAGSARLESCGAICITSTGSAKVADPSTLLQRPRIGCYSRCTY